MTSPRSGAAAILAECAQRLRASGEPDAAFAAARIEDMIERMQAPRRRGGVSPDHAERLSRRDEAIRELDRLGKAGEKLERRTAAVHRALQRYETTAWPRDRRAGAPPADPERKLLYQVLAVGAKVPKLRRLRDILRGEN